MNYLIAQYQFAVAVRNNLLATSLNINQINFFNSHFEIYLRFHVIDVQPTKEEKQ